MQRQEPLVKAANKIRDAVEKADATGFAGIGVEGDQVTLRWKGTPPPAVTRAVRQAKTTTPVQITSVEHSQTDLYQAADRLWASSGVLNGGTATRDWPGLTPLT